MTHFTEPEAGQESVWDYPRPPRLEAVSKKIIVRHRGEEIANTRRAIRVLETSHPPVYYIPQGDIRMEFLYPDAGRRSWCEWKGVAAYWDLVIADKRIKGSAWSYPDPAPGFEEIRNHLAFYASKVEECFVGAERVEAQQGDFYGGWITSNILGPFKGGEGTVGW